MGLLLRYKVRGEFLYAISQSSFWTPNRASLLTETLTGALSSFLGALAQVAGSGGGKGGRGGQIWKGLYSLDFSVRNPNRTWKAKPVTVLKGRERERRRRNIPIKEAGATGH